MPPVYAKSDTSATGWRRYSDGSDESEVDASFPDWITPDCVITGKNDQEICLRTFLEGCQSFTTDEGRDKVLAVYYLVVSHKGNAGLDAEPEFTNASGVQIYIGLAYRGIMKRWRTHTQCTKNALEKTKACADSVKYVNECKSRMLADVFLALAHLCKFEVALFVYKCCENYEEMEKTERDLISEHAATNSKHGLNVRDEKTKKKNENKNVKGKKKTE